MAITLPAKSNPVDIQPLLPFDTKPQSRSLGSGASSSHGLLLDEKSVESELKRIKNRHSTSQGTSLNNGEYQ